ncbi:MAG: SHOCT domain-containing protein [Cyclobacteriaceae bacterium]
MEMYEGYHYWGMHLVWWFIWIIFIFWVFAIPYSIPGQRSKREEPLDILKKRFATGEIEKEEYLETKRLLN